MAMVNFLFHMHKKYTQNTIPGNTSAVFLFERSDFCTYFSRAGPSFMFIADIKWSSFSNISA